MVLIVLFTGKGTHKLIKEEKNNSQTYINVNFITDFVYCQVEKLVFLSFVNIEYKMGITMFPKPNKKTFTNKLTNIALISSFRIL